MIILFLCLNYYMIIKFIWQLLTAVKYANAFIDTWYYGVQKCNIIHSSWQTNVEYSYVCESVSSILWCAFYENVHTCYISLSKSFRRFDACIFLFLFEEIKSYFLQERSKKLKISREKRSAKLFTYLFSANGGWVELVQLFA